MKPKRDQIMTLAIKVQEARKCVRASRKAKR